MKLLLLPFVLFILTIAACTQRPDKNGDKKAPDSPFPKEAALSTRPGTTMLPTLEHQMPADKNALWCATLPLAWHHLRDTLPKPMKIAPRYADLALLDASTSYLNALQKDEYEAEVEWSGNEISVRTFYKKSLPFAKPWPMKNQPLKWGDRQVKAFGLYGETEMASVVYFTDSTDFALRLHAKDDKQEILLYAPPRGTHYPTLSAALAAFTQKKNQFDKIEHTDENEWLFELTHLDRISIPNLAFHLSTNYNKLEGSHFEAGDVGFTITKAWQRIAFVLNEKGAELESEAEIKAETAAPPMAGNPVPKHFVFDRPYLLVIKAKDQPNPHFVAWVENAELMEALR